MARTGSFGRQPRPSPSITATLIAIAREMQSQEDSNIMDAWMKGGLIDGEQVTDEKVLEHWKQRLAGISEDDPLYETYSNSVLQLDYSIHESKMTAAYALITDPTPADNMKMANFFLNWAKKVPKNSEFYRTLQRDAGQYMRAAKAKRVQSGRDNSEQEFQAQMVSLERKHEAAGQEALRVLTLLGQEGAVIGRNPLGNRSDIANRSNIGDVQVEGIDELIAVLDTVMNDTAVVSDATGFTTGKRITGPNTAVLYQDENGRPVTGVDLVAKFKALDPSFDGTFNLGYVQGAISSARDGINKRIALARKTGHVAQAMSLEYEQAKLNDFARQVDAYPVVQEYDDISAALGAVLNDNTLLPDAQVAKIQALRTRLGKLANDPRIADDLRMQTQLQAEAEGREGVPTLYEDRAGTTVGFTDRADGIRFANERLALFDEQKRAVDAGQMVYTQGAYVKDPVSGKEKFVAQAGGPFVGAAPMADINNLPGSGRPVPVLIPNGDGAGATPAYVMPTAIYVKASHADGSPMSGTNANPAGYFIQYPVNGKVTTLYQIERNGTKEWSDDPPWDKDAVSTDVTNGVMTVTLRISPNAAGVDPTLRGVVPGAPGYYITGPSTNASGQPLPGELRFNPQESLYATDLPRHQAGSDPFTDSFSASLASLHATPDGTRLLNAWSADPRFKVIMEQNARMADGQTFDETTGLWQGGRGEYDRNIASLNSALDYARAGRPAVLVPSSMSDWRRDTTDLAPDAVKAVVRPGMVGRGAFAGRPDDRLPSDVIREAKDSRFTAMSFAFQARSNQLAAPKSGSGLTIGISPADIKVPTVNTRSTFAPPPYVPPATVAPKAVSPLDWKPPPVATKLPEYTPPPTPQPVGTPGSRYRK